MHWQTMLTRVDEEVLKQKNCKNFHAHKKKKFLAVQIFAKDLPLLLDYSLVLIVIIIKVDAQIKRKSLLFEGSLFSGTNMTW